MDMNLMWYKSPAKRWREALPLGNGLTGVMVFGGKRKERLCFNDGTLWSGYPKDQTNPSSLKALGEVRRLIFEGKNAEADALAEKEMTGGYSESFLPLGELLINLSAACKADGKALSAAGNCEKYTRKLDLKTAVHEVCYAGIVRTAFVSYPDKVSVYHITAKSEAKAKSQTASANQAVSANRFDIEISAKSQLKSEVHTADGGINLVGNAPDHVVPNYVRSELKPIRYDEGKGMSFCLRTEVDTDGKVECYPQKIVIKNASYATLVSATATGFLGYKKMPSTDRGYVVEKCKATLKTAGKDYENLKARHIADFSAIFQKQHLSLSSYSDKPTDVLVKLAKKHKDNNKNEGASNHSDAGNTALIELFYNYGKYMMLSGSRAGGQALNLQGIWNDSVRPPWSSNYTVNINTQMNYWAASRCNLKEALPPFFELVSEVAEHGKRTAEINYGSRGFACNHNVDIWRKTTPVLGSTAYMLAPLCGLWLANEAYAHFKNGEMTAFEPQIAEIVKQAALFASDSLVEHEGYLVICPSSSPEASFLSDGKKSSLDWASAFDMGLVRQTFKNFAEMLPGDPLLETIKKQEKQLYPFKNGTTGILEWHTDFQIAEKGHRHFSPLYAFYPGDVLGYYGNKTEVEWVKNLFLYRISHIKSAIGWNAAWATALAARLHDGKTALSMLNALLKKSVCKNLFGTHPPCYFQIDGNFGAVAGVNEMLLYVENDIIELLPALPLGWKSGEVKGFLVNGAEVSFAWKNGEVVSVESDRDIKIRSTHISKNCKINANVSIV